MKTHISKCEARRPKYRKKTTYFLHKEGDIWSNNEVQGYYQDDNWGYYGFSWMMKRHIKEKTDE